MWLVRIEPTTTPTETRWQTTAPIQFSSSGTGKNFIYCNGSAGGGKWAADLAVSSAPVSLFYFSVERIKIISV